VLLGKVLRGWIMLMRRKEMGEGGVRVITNALMLRLPYNLYPPNSHKLVTIFSNRTYDADGAYCSTYDGTYDPAWQVT